jgi:putative peptidoglycan lipid II flippase
MNVARPTTELKQILWDSCGARAGLFFSKPGFVRNALLVSALTVAVKVIGAAKIAISAKVLGTGDELDSYLVAFLVPSILSDVLAGSLTPALMPVLAKETDHQTGGSGANRVFFLECLGVFGIAMLIAASTASWVLPGIAHGFSSYKLQFTRSLLLLMVPMVPLSGLSAVWRAILNHQGRFALSAGSPLVTPLLASTFLLGTNGRGVHALALGTVLGAAAEASLLGAGLVLTGASILPRIRPDFSMRRWLSSGYLPVLVASVIGAGSSVIDQTIAASLGTGSVSVLNLGTRLVTVLVAIGPASMATVVMPRFSKLVADGDRVRLRHLAGVSTLVGMLFMIPVTMVGIWSSKPLAELAFARGTGVPDPIGVIATVQALSFLQLPFVMGTAVLSRLLISAHKTRQLLLISASALVLKVGIGLSLAYVMGIEGLSLSMSFVQLVVFLMTVPIALRGLRQSRHSGDS